MDGAIDHQGQATTYDALPFLAADIGGTHARIACVRVARSSGFGFDVLAYREFACADFAGPEELLRAFIERDVRGVIRRCVLACAGQPLGDDVLNDNLAWPIHVAQLRRSLGFDDVATLNDFEALAWALDGIADDSGRLLCGPAGRVDGPALVIGPGTGLGAAVRLRRRVGDCVLPTEAGQMDFAPVTPLEREVLAYLSPNGGYVAYERIVSGPGLLVLYTALCELSGKAPRLASPEAVTAAASASSDAQAAEAFGIFAAALGSFAGSLAMTFMATGGVYLAGGFLSAVFDLLQQSGFRERYLHANSVRAFLARVPVRVIAHGRYGVLGAARWYVGHGTAELRQAAVRGAAA